jgi:hypothetical protein
VGLIFFGNLCNQESGKGFFQSARSFFLTGRERELKIILVKGGEVHEMDVPPRNPLLDLWFVAMVLSKTLNGSSEDKGNHSELFKDFKGR